MSFSPFTCNLIGLNKSVPSQQKIRDQQGPHMGFYMGPI